MDSGIENSSQLLQASPAGLDFAPTPDVMFNLEADSSAFKISSRLMPFRIGSFAVSLMLISLRSAPLWAESGSPTAPAAPVAPVQPKIVPPHLAMQPDVPYPTEAKGDASVILRLTINADGTVRDAQATEGDDPFAAAAVKAANSWRFDPATRDGTPVAAIVRFEVSFVEPPPVAQGTAADSPAPSDKAGADSTHSSANAEKPATTMAAPAPEDFEITVQGERLAPAVSSFSRAEVRQLPGAFGDPFRAIEAMPGVTPIISGLPFFYVRGAPPGNVGYFLDGIRVPYLYHVGLGPSVIHPAMVDRVDLYPGGYPASFGRFAGGIVSGEATKPRTDLHGEANIRLFDLGGMAETGFGNGRGTVLLGGRYSYTATLLSLISPSTDLAYRDFQARVTYDLTPKDRVTAFGFGSYDLVGQTTNGIETIAFGSEFYRLDLRHDHDYGHSTTLHTAVTLGYDQTLITTQRNAQDRMLSVRTVLHHPLSHDVLWRAGGDVTVDGFTADKAKYADPEDPTTVQFNNLFPPRTDLAAGAWSDFVINVGPRLQLTPGLRADVYSSGGATMPALDPRIAAKYNITDHFRIIHAYGVAHQPPSFVVPIPGLTPGNLQGGLQSSVQTSAGIEIDLPESMKATATVFHNAFYSMNDALGDRSNTTTGGIGNALTQRANGQAYGFEFFLHRRLNKRLGGFLTYTLSRSTRTLNNSTFPSAFDRTHVANAALAYDLGRSWRAGTRLVFYTGTPVITPTGGLVVAQPTLSNDRNSPFYRVDVRLEKRWKLSQTAWISFIAEVMNVTLSKETYNSTVIGPITIPSIGAEAGF
jgi:TonB family protein